MSLFMPVADQTYHLSEILGCAEEYDAIPCSSLRTRLLEAIARAAAVEAAAKAKAQEPPASGDVLVRKTL